MASQTDNRFFLFWQLTKRDIIGRYRGSWLGLIWSFINPLIMLLIYSFVFVFVFEARWGETVTGAKGEFVVILFAGLMLHMFFAECLTRAPTLITSNPNYVKKVIFPLDILPLTLISSAFFHLLISIGLLLIAQLVVFETIYWTLLWLPLILIPFILLALGLSWILASLGVFIRDIAQMMGLLTTILLFVSPIFYAIDRFPIFYQQLFYLNPLSFMVEQVRAVVIWQQHPHWLGLAIYSVIAITVASLGYMWFAKTRKGFADVL